jgi:hypothetical protein
VAGKLGGLLSFGSHPVAATLATVAALATLAAAAIGLAPLLRGSDPVDAVPAPADPTGGPAALDTGGAAMSVLYTQDGDLTLASAGGPLDQAVQGGHGQSQAVLAIPAGGAVTHAELLWAASNPGQGWWDVALQNPEGQVSNVEAQHRVAMDGAVQLTADVTDLVAQCGPGAWALTDVALAAGGPQAWAAWALVAVVEPGGQAEPQRVTLYAGALPVAEGQHSSQEVAAPAMSLSQMVAVVWGGADSGQPTSAWLLDAAGDASLSQGYAATPSTRQGAGIEVLTGEQGFFPTGIESNPSPAVAFRQAATTALGEHVGFVGVVAPLTTNGQ